MKTKNGKAGREKLRGEECDESGGEPSPGGGGGEGRCLKILLLYTLLRYF